VEQSGRRGRSPAIAPASDGDLEPLDDEQPAVLTVSELNRSIKSLLEGKFSLIWLKGEISNFKAHTSGHFYFSLKDSKAQIGAVMFRGFNAGLKFRPEDGMEVLVRGRVTVYEPRGNYQVFCEMMEPVGAGALQKAFEQLRAKLQAEGLFDAARKRALPALPRHIAIVTSPTGAAIRDMLNVLGRRFKGARVTLVPAKVQGDQAPAEIVAAIAAVDRMDDVDVLIVGRGGGSIEDLWAFNDERVARAIAGARAPTISAVGHEVDFTIADFVADLRAPTPSAAAELVVRNAADLVAQLAALARALQLAWHRKQDLLRHKLDGTSRRLVDPQRRLQDLAMRCDELSQRLEAATARRLEALRMRVALWREKLGNPAQRLARERQRGAALCARLGAGAATTVARKRDRWSRLCAVLDSLSPLKVVERGYAIVTIGTAVVKDVAQAPSGSEIRLQFARGRALARIERVESERGVGD
jgi:exodeoxyribonuclease VII large subunit